ncbi:uncharacterized protein LOC132739010 [Ruditapes philippinarum]|uniref:uncharacterized protein LOC132739010 n=1 Tax=Ruditapes philippinarum TaxID=129788 RepID=UPI00295BD6E0|nr:uncharacterized protein LOC132739010 [Ruditapes philippinarum]
MHCPSPLSVTAKMFVITLDNHCGTVSLRTEKVVENGNVEIEYCPSFAMLNRDRLERKWIRFDGRFGETLTLNGGSYEEKMEQHNKYILIIYRFNVSMKGQYRVYCGSPVDMYTDPVTVNLPEPPSVLVIVGLRDIENCKDCIVGEDNEMFKLVCEIHGGSRPLTVTMTIGNESYTPLEWNLTTYMVLFTVRDHHHMTNVLFSVMNDALSSPLNVSAKMFVIINPDDRETGDNMSTTAHPDGRETGNYMSTTGKTVLSMWVMLYVQGLSF